MLKAEEERWSGIAEGYVLIRETGWSGPSLKYAFMVYINCSHWGGKGGRGGGLVV